jgi:glycosyltransferase involved in cell wall biosynthesis
MSLDDETKVLLLHSVASPYRLPVFEAFARRFDVDVAFCKESESGRKWDSNVDSLEFEASVFPSVMVGPVVLNYTAPWKLLFGDYDAVIMDGYDPFFPTAFLALFAAKLRGKPFVLWTEHVDAPEFGWRYARSSPLGRFRALVTFGFVNAYQTLLYRHVDRFVAFSRKAKRYLLRRGADRRRVTTGIQVMPAECLPDDPDPELAPEMDEDGVSILSLGYLRGGKGLDVLIEAYKEAATPDTQLVVAGAGEEEDALRRRAGDRDDIVFPGYVDGEQKAAYYAGADVFVLPTRLDAWGLVVNEAMYYGLPVVTTTAAGSKWLIDDNGFVVDPDDPDMLAERLARLVEDPELRSAMGQRSSARADAFDAETMAATLERAVESVVS